MTYSAIKLNKPPTMPVGDMVGSVVQGTYFSMRKLPRVVFIKTDERSYVNIQTGTLFPLDEDEIGEPVVVYDAETTLTYPDAK